MIRPQAAWLIAFIGCLALGAVQVCKQAAFRFPRVDDADASLRDIAAQHLGSDRALDELRAAIETLPQHHAIVVVGPAQEWGSTEIYLLTSCLAWPRSVWFVALGPDGKPAPSLGHQPPRGTPISALAFYSVTPPTDPGTPIHRIGSKFFIVPQDTAP